MKLHSGFPGSHNIPVNFSGTIAINLDRKASPEEQARIIAPIRAAEGETILKQNLWQDKTRHYFLLLGIPDRARCREIFQQLKARFDTQPHGAIRHTDMDFLEPDGARSRVIDKEALIGWLNQIQLPYAPVLHVERLLAWV